MFSPLYHVRTRFQIKNINKRGQCGQSISNMQDADNVILYHKLKLQSPNNIIQSFKVYYFGELLTYCVIFS
jgi:hypothetical protein